MLLSDLLVRHHYLPTALATAGFPRPTPRGYVVANVGVTACLWHSGGLSLGSIKHVVFYSNYYYYYYYYF